MATRAASAVRERDGPGALFAFAVLRPHRHRAAGALITERRQGACQQALQHGVVRRDGRAQDPARVDQALAGAQQGQAEQYAQEQKQLREQVNSLGGYVQKLERQVNASAKQHREEVNKLTERVDDLIKQHAEALLDFQTRCNTLVGDVNAFARLLEEEWK